MSIENKEFETLELKPEEVENGVSEAFKKLSEKEKGEAPENKKVETRGRKKGSTKKVLEQKKEKKTADQPAGKTISLSDLKEEYKTVSTETVQKENEPVKVTPEAPVMVSGYVLLLICDFVLPSLVVRLMKSRKPNLKASDISLNKTEWTKLEPLADHASAVLFGRLDPVTGFFISMGSIYMGKAMTYESK